MKIKFSKVNPIKIVVLHETNIEFLQPLFQGVPYKIIQPENLEVYITPSILKETIFYFTKIKNLRISYILALVKAMRPSIVITYIDNSYVFQQLTKHDDKIRFLAIQNGNRLLDRDNPPDKPKIFLKEFACIGRYEIDQYKMHGAQVRNFYPIGTLKDAFYRRGLVENSTKKIYDICLVSQIRPGLQKKYTERLESFNLIVSFVKKFSETYNLSVCVAMRTHPERNLDLYNWEDKWFRLTLGSKVVLYPNKLEEYTTYQLSDQSVITVGMHSTAMREAFGRRNRILSCNFSGNSTYDFQVDGPWALNVPDYSAFEERMLNLLNIEENDYARISNNAVSYLFGYDVKYPADKFLVDLISDAIS